MADETPKTPATSAGAAKPAEPQKTPAAPVEDKSVGTANVPEMSKNAEKELEDILGNEPEPQVTEEMELLRKKVLNLSSRLNSDTPNDHSLFGLGGIVFTVGDLRLLAKNAGTL